MNNESYFYPLIKLVLGIICLILAAEYAYTYCVYQQASFGILYIGDTLTWFLAGFVLFTEGLQGYLRAMTARRVQDPLEALQQA